MAEMKRVVAHLRAEIALLENGIPSMKANITVLNEELGRAGTALDRVLTTIEEMKAAIAKLEQPE